MAYAEINGARLFFTDAGTGTPIVLVHGTSADSFDWNYQIPTLAEQFRVIAFDRRGHGHSSIPEDGYGPLREADDILSLLDLIGVKQVVAVGHSTGAGVVAWFAATYPDRVRAMVAVDPSYGVPAAMRGAFADICDKLAKDGGHEVLRTMFVPFYTSASPKHLQSWHARRVYSVPERVLAAVTAATTLGEDQFFFSPQSEEVLARVKSPALTVRRVLRGGVGSDWDRQQFSHPYSMSVEWENAGHWPHQERPDEFNSILIDWLEGLAG